MELRDLRQMGLSLVAQCFPDGTDGLLRRISDSLEELLTLCRGIERWPDALVDQDQCIMSFEDGNHDKFVFKIEMRDVSPHHGHETVLELCSFEGLHREG